MLSGQHSSWKWQNKTHFSKFAFSRGPLHSWVPIPLNLQNIPLWLLFLLSHIPSDSDPLSHKDLVASGPHGSFKVLLLCKMSQALRTTMNTSLRPIAFLQREQNSTDHHNGEHLDRVIIQMNLEGIMLTAQESNIQSHALCVSVSIAFWKRYPSYQRQGLWVLGVRGCAKATLSG